jgi:hypothetical protein
MDEYDYLKELERHKCDEEAQAKLLADRDEEIRMIKEELKFSAKHRSLQRNCSIAARMNGTKPKGFRARANLHK